MAGRGHLAAGSRRRAPPWTAKSEVRWILDEFFVQEDIDVDVGMESNYTMRSVYRWDAENRQYVMFSAGNEGEAYVAEPHWVDDHTMVVNYASAMEGTPLVGRSTWSFGDGKYEFKNERADAAGAWFVALEGSFQKTDDVSIDAMPASFMNRPVAEPVRKLEPMCGDWRVDGWMRMPGTDEKTPIGGQEHTETILGGHVIRSHTTSDPMPSGRWVGDTYIAWNAERNRFWVVMMSNMGEFSSADGYWVDDHHFVSIGAGLGVRLADGVPRYHRVR